MLVTTSHSDEKKLIKRVRAAGQAHVFRFWEELDNVARNKLISQLRVIDFGLLNELHDKLVKNGNNCSGHSNLEPAEFVPIPKTDAEKRIFDQAKVIGENALREGRVAACVVAGGQATRLGFAGPKGMFPITPIKQKSFFQIYAEQIKALSMRHDTVIPWYIMTSESNHAQTIEFFESQDYFGLNADDIRFFQQGMVPALDEHGRLILDAKDHIFMNPNGHGGSLSALHKSGSLKDMRRRGIDLLFYFQIDNVLVKICDPVFIGFHLQKRAQMSAKVVSKRDARERVGVLAKISGRLGVIEYSDLPDAEKFAKNWDGTLKFRAGNLAIHAFDIDFIERLNHGKFKLPWHVAHKAIPYLDEQGRIVRPSQPNGYKFETFMFDALTKADRSVILEACREDEFSPVKNLHGSDSPETAHRDMIALYAKWLDQAGVPVPRDHSNTVIGRIEISPLFALDFEEFAAKLDHEIKFDGSLYLG